MSHPPISIQSISLFFPSIVCFSNFSHTINAGDRIGIVGRCASGKSSLLKLITDKIIPNQGQIISPKGIKIGYLDQIPPKIGSGAQSFHHALTAVLSRDPDILLLDEPTNHLDGQNRKRLFVFLRSWRKTLIIVSHDAQLLQGYTSSIGILKMKR